jgi:aspartate/methionine/tyrosine aminotransferase
MVMDVMAAAARIEARGGRVVHMEVGQPAAPAPRTARRRREAALDLGDIGYTEALGFPACAPRSRGNMPSSTASPSSRSASWSPPARRRVSSWRSWRCSSRATGSRSRVPAIRRTGIFLTALGCEPVLIEISQATRWSITVDALLETHRRTPLKGVLVASPANPTGTMMRPEALSELIAAAEGEGIRFISDEIYHRLDYAFPAETAAKFSDNAVIINSFSKYFCMTGWRVGWMVVPEPLLRSVERLQQNLAISVPTLSQVAAAAAFDGRDEMEAVKHGYEENRLILTNGLPRAGLPEFLPVDGAFYLYADVSRFTDDSLAFAQRMLEEAGVAATPGIDFDPIRGNRFIRFSYARSPPTCARRWNGSARG